MLQLFEPRPDLRSAHIFADHLEAVLDLAEELELLHLIPSDAERAPGGDVSAGLDRIGAFVERIEALELAIAVKLEHARAAAQRIARADARLSTFTRLFSSGTQPLVDLLPTLADPGGRIFESGHDPLTFLQARGVVDESSCSLEGRRFLGTGAEYLLLGTARLGAFIELCDTCLKAIDRHYHIYEDDADWEADRVETLELLRQTRDEAIRVAVGGEAPPIETPVEILPIDAVDEAIELIDALTFPEAQRFEIAPELPVAPALDVEAVPIELEASALEEPAEAPDTADASASFETPLILDAEAIVEAGSGPESEPEAARSEAAGETAETPADAAAAETRYPGLLGSLGAARRSLAGILAQRKTQIALKMRTTAPVEPVDEAPVATAEPAVMLPDVTEGVETAVVAAESSMPVRDAALEASRQRLVDLIAARAGRPAETGAGDTEPVAAEAQTSPAAATGEPTSMSELSAAEDMAVPPNEMASAPNDTDEGLPAESVIEPPLRLTAPADESVSEVSEVPTGVHANDPAEASPTVATEPHTAVVGEDRGSLAGGDDTSVSAPPAEATGEAETSGNAIEDAAESTAGGVVSEVATEPEAPEEPTPARRKRRRRASRRKSTPRKRRAKAS
ncbi:MAG: hypothetical protein R3D57_07100 [Hyphomicrobiaceae bacterium]